jgi:late competence protein required for DNA uptake (superfamily II DNA/RNA helicase)
MNKQTYFRKMLRTKKLLSMLESWLTENEKDELRDLLKQFWTVPFTDEEWEELQEKYKCEKSLLDTTLWR